MRTRMGGLALVMLSLLAQSAPTEAAPGTPEAAPEVGLNEERAWTPAYVPRYATLGVMSSINKGGCVSPLVRVGWEPTLIDQRTNLVVPIELGAAYSTILPAGATDLYQYSATVGLGLRPKHDRTLQWGFSVLLGVVFYGAHFPGPYVENWSDGMVEGRFSLGYNFGPLSLSGFFGVAQIWYINIRKLASQLAGGWNVGISLDWR